MSKRSREANDRDNSDNAADDNSYSDMSSITPQKGKLKSILKRNTKQEVLRSNTHHELALSVASYKIRKSPLKKRASRKSNISRVKFRAEPQIFFVESYKTYNKLMNVNTRPKKTCFGCVLS